jgi:dihydropyrimidinase
MEITGWPTITISRGEVVWRDGEFVAAKGRGRFLPCAPPAPARPKGMAVATFQ